jgi:hypothetical protein
MNRALRLIDSNADLLPAGHALLNRHVAEALADGLIRHAPHRRIAWELTPRGRARIEETP